MLMLQKLCGWKISIITCNVNKFLIIPTIHSINEKIERKADMQTYLFGCGALIDLEHRE
jgi:hypothetical protein